MSSLMEWFRRQYGRYFAYQDTGTAKGLTVTVSPSSGPPITTVTIRISGARPGDPVSVLIGLAGAAGAPFIADANGELIITDQISGFRPGETVKISAEAGSVADRKGMAEFKVTGEKPPV
jgi:hypothetical protein